MTTVQVQEILFYFLGDKEILRENETYLTEQGTENEYK